jgi:signal transduction histidine kinase
MVGQNMALAPAAGPAGSGRPLLDALVAALPLGVLLQDTNQRVVAVNTAFIRLAGISVRPEELVGVTFDGSAQHVLDLFEGGGRARVPDDEVAPGRTVERECVPLRAGGELLGHLWLLRDVTDQAAARRAAVEQDRVRADLAALRSDFVATVSHELRTPLTSIVGLSTLLLETAQRLDPEQTECLQAIERSADRLLRLADDLTLLAGLESHGLPLRDEPLDLVALAAARVAAWQQAADAAGIALRLDWPDPARPDRGRPVRGDGRLLARMLDGLVAAAVQASPPGGRVDLSVRPAADAWVIEITDPAQPDAPPGAEPPGRHDAGLEPIISRAIAKRHNGTTGAGGTAAGGPTVRIQLPVDGAAAPGRAGIPSTS